MLLNITKASYAPFIGTTMTTENIKAASNSFNWSLTNLGKDTYRYSCNTNNDFVIGNKV